MKPSASVSPLPVRGSEVPVRPAVVPILLGRSGRTVGVVVEDREGIRWQPTPDIEGLVRLGIAAAAAVALPVGVLGRRPGSTGCPWARVAGSASRGSRRRRGGVSGDRGGPGCGVRAG
jgi:hypothetical protein